MLNRFGQFQLCSLATGTRVEHCGIFEIGTVFLEKIQFPVFPLAAEGLLPDNKPFVLGKIETNCLLSGNKQQTRSRSRFV